MAKFGIANINRVCRSLTTASTVGQVRYTHRGFFPVKVARIYLRVSTDEQDLARQAEIEQSTRSSGYYIAGVYREKASGARADRPELLRMIADLQPGEAVASQRELIASAGSPWPRLRDWWARSGAREQGWPYRVWSICPISRPGLTASPGSCWSRCRSCSSSWPCKWRAMTMRHAASDSVRVCNLPKPPANTRGVSPMPPPISASSRCAA